MSGTTGWSSQRGVGVDCRRHRSTPRGCMTAKKLQQPRHLLSQPKHGKQKFTSAPTASPASTPSPVLALDSWHPMRTPAAEPRACNNGTNPSPVSAHLMNRDRDVWGAYARFVCTRHTFSPQAPPAPSGNTLCRTTTKRVNPAFYLLRTCGIRVFWKCLVWVYPPSCHWTLLGLEERENICRQMVVP